MRVMYKSVLAIVLFIILGAWAMADSHIPLPNTKGPIATSELKNLFQQFIQKYERMYTTDAAETERRFNIFKTNVEKARFYNAMTEDNVYGITKFSDMEESEFNAQYLMKNPITPDEYRKTFLKNAKVDRVPKKLVDAAPETWNWMDHGAVTAVKNQGSCGSCWAFSTTGNVEGQWYLANKELIPLSEQQLVDCDHYCDPAEPKACDAGCNGGLMWNAMQYIQDIGGIASEAAYPYRARDNTCTYRNETRAATISSWKMLPTDEEELAAWLVNYGPVAVALNAEWLQFYMGGISDPLFCNPKALSHAVLLVGYGTGKTILGKEKKYWLVKNSWGTSWGSSGYFKIAKGKNTCGIAEVPCSVIV